MTAEVFARVVGRIGWITLNRPQALHALTTDMCRAMIEALRSWRSDPVVALVLIDHAGERGFCAGGDIRMLAESGAADAVAAREFFFTEYRLNDLIFGYPKPVCTVMDGITMGGGVGLAAPSTYRIATERTTFAMPETGIGLFPDVGGGWHLPRLHGEAGVWLALTGARIKAADCLLLGLATDFVRSERLEAFKVALVDAPAAIETLLTELEDDPGRPPLAEHRDAIDRLFAPSRMEEIVAGLAADGSDWAGEQLATLRTKSPQTMKAALRQLRTGATLASFAENMAMEYRIASRVVRRHDFIEGVRAVIVAKDNRPRWNPASLEEVTADMLDEIFAPLPADEEWSPLD